MSDLYQVALDAEKTERDADAIAAARRAILYLAADSYSVAPTTEKWEALGAASDAWHTAREIADAHHAATVAAWAAWLRTVKL